jgi:hypothetical protein
MRAGSFCSSLVLVLLWNVDLDLILSIGAVEMCRSFPLSVFSTGRLAQSVFWITASAGLWGGNHRLKVMNNSDLPSVRYRCIDRITRSVAREQPNLQRWSYGPTWSAYASTRSIGLFSRCYLTFQNNANTHLPLFDQISHKANHRMHNHISRHPSLPIRVCICVLHWSPSHSHPPPWITELSRSHSLSLDPFEWF